MKHNTQNGSQASRQAEIYTKAMASIKRENLRNAAGGHALMATAAAYGSASSKNSLFGKTARFAQYFMIGFIFVTPNIMFIRHML
ncbi:MAG: hypothetical protein P8Q92_16230 [Pseudoprimorskyibacter sp.]|nr:hypothetical protein [Pseudoprimorskyibacter sp.]